MNIVFIKYYLISSLNENAKIAPTQFRFWKKAMIIGELEVCTWCTRHISNIKKKARGKKWKLKP